MAAFEQRGWCARCRAARRDLQTFAARARATAADSARVSAPRVTLGVLQVQVDAIARVVS